MDQEPAGSREEGFLSQFRWCCGRLLRLGFCLFCGVLLLSYLGRYHWVLDNLTAGLVQLTMSIGGFLIAFVLVRQWHWASVALVMLLASVVRLVPTSAPAADTAGQPIRIVSANVHTSNRQFALFVEFVEKTDPDLLLVPEADHDWERGLSRLRNAYPHVVSVPREDNFGLILYSRFPFAEAEILRFGEASIPMVVASFPLEKGTLKLVGAHPLPPVSEEYALRRNELLASIGSIVRDATGPCLVIGDFNIAPWSPHFQDLLADSKLRDTRRGWVVGATWPTHLPLLMTPIDHALVSADINVIDRQVGPEIGSDHLPIVLDIAVTAADR